VAVESSDTDLENSDFDLALDEADAPAADESESQVVLLDDEAADPAAAPTSGRTSRRAAAVAAPRGKEESEDEDSASAALSGVPRGERDDEDEGPVRVAAPAKWGALPAIVLLPCLVFTFLGGIMAFELLHGMWGYNQGTKPGGTIVRGFAGMLDMDPKD